ncbi:hypothetical protein PV08_08801 [Exophiala spinifera]|uniref:Zn(2)-C6 fungal-type domain-containing protein n=1 Tax=Exophiala spinifera TaxID=91928 RepID=A0A0D1YEX4_9EURO|nr:uncharacterized protein PV08_08801 [Exophiala spinifera]KIW13611.1 hypothetical protein PV08_08801 [Exophiala spinifera]
MPPEDPSRGRRTRVACRNCRQAKIRCALNRIPCARCQRLGLTCSIEPSYKRTNKQDQVEELQQRLSSLQGVIDRHLPARSTPSRPHLDTSQSTLDGLGEEGGSGHTPHNENRSDTPPFRPSSLQSVGQGVEYTLGNVTITLERAQTLFATFFETCHAFLPIFDASRTSPKCHDNSPLLFWAIIAVSSRRIGDDLLSSLTPELTRLLWTVIGGGLFSLPNVQALLLLASWTPPDMHLWTDKSLVLARLAMTSAEMMGMNRPGCEGEYSKQSTNFTSLDIAERSRTWLASVALCQSLSTDIGTGPNPCFSDVSIRKACLNAEAIPLELHHSLIIQKVTNEALRSWQEAAEEPYGNPGEAVGWDLIHKAEQRFLAISQQFWNYMSFANRLHLQVSQLRLQCLFMLYNTGSDVQNSGILRAYNTATELINTVLSEVDGPQHLQYAPSILARHIFSAGLVIIRVLHSTASIGLDYERGRILSNAAAFSLSQLSSHQKPKDQAARASDLLRRFWSAAERSPNMRQRDLRLRVKSRMGASLLYDCLMSIRNSNRPESTEAAAFEGNQARTDALAAVPGTTLNAAAEYSNTGGMDPLSAPTWYDFDLFQFTPGVDLSDMFVFEDAGCSAVP